MRIDYALFLVKLKSDFGMSVFSYAYMFGDLVIVEANGFKDWRLE